MSLGSLTNARGISIELHGVNMGANNSRPISISSGTQHVQEMLTFLDGVENEVLEQDSIVKRVMATSVGLMADLESNGIDPLSVNSVLRASDKIERALKELDELFPKINSVRNQVRRFQSALANNPSSVKSSDLVRCLEKVADVSTQKDVNIFESNRLLDRARGLLQEVNRALQD